MLDAAGLSLIVAVFLLAGFVKGVTGMGLPTVALALLATTMDHRAAIALVLVPSLATNVWQALTGGHLRVLAVRLWPFQLAAFAFILIAAPALARVEGRWPAALLGALVIVFALVGLRGARLLVAPRWEAWAAPAVGAANGVLTGLTGSFVFPGVLYLQGLGLPRDALIQAMGLHFLVSTLGLAVALGAQQVLTAPLGLASFGALAPAALGLLAGQRLRQRIPEARFRRLVLWALLSLGAYILVSSLLGP